MKKILWGFGILCWAISPVWGQDTGEENSAEAVREIIEGKNAQLEQWYAEGELDSLVSVVEVDVIQMPPHHPPIKGRDAFRDNWEQSFGFGTWDFDFEVEEVRVSGDQAVELGKFSLEFTPNESSPIPEFKDMGHYLVLWERQDGEWKVVWDAPVSSKSRQDMMAEMQQMGQMGKKHEK